MNSNISTQLALQAARARGARAPVTSDPSDQMNKCEERLLTLVEGAVSQCCVWSQRINLPDEPPRCDTSHHVAL